MLEKIIQGFALYDTFKRLSSGFKTLLDNGLPVGQKADMPVPAEYAENAALLLKGPNNSRFRVESVTVRRIR
jgi:hypothetical protein